MVFTTPSYRAGGRSGMSPSRAEGEGERRRRTPPACHTRREAKSSRGAGGPLCRRPLAHPDMAMETRLRAQELERGAHSLLERGLGGGVASLDRMPGLLRAKTELPEALDHLSGPLRRTPGALPLLTHEARPESAVRLVLIVGTAPQPYPLHRCPAPERHRVDVIELQERALPAAVSGCADEGALALIALPDGAPDMRRDESPTGGAARARPRLRGRRELALLELVDEGIE